MKTYRTLIAIFAGIAAAFTLRYINKFFAFTQETCCGPTGDAFWQILVAAPKGALMTLIPGAVAGWISRDRGLLCGFLVGFLTSALFMTIYGSFWGRPAINGTALHALEFVLICLGGGIFGTAAGGAAQLVRSNSSFKPSPHQGGA